MANQIADEYQNRQGDGHGRDFVFDTSCCDSWHSAQTDMRINVCRLDGIVVRLRTRKQHFDFPCSSIIANSSMLKPIELSPTAMF
jgi:hypothetical protein